MVDWVSLAGYGSTFIGGSALAKLIEWRRERSRSSDASTRTEIDHLRAEVADLKRTVETIRDEKHVALNKCFVAQIQAVIFKSEVNALLVKAGEVPRYDLHADDPEQAPPVLQL